MEKFKVIRYHPDEIIYERSQKSRDVFLSTKGEMLCKQTNRIFSAGTMIGQDDILFNTTRQYTLIAHTELFLLRLEREDFEKMLRDFPEIKAAIQEQADLRRLYTQKQADTRSAIAMKDSKLIIRMFNGTENVNNYQVQQEQRIPALRRKDVQYRRSIEFLYKDKRLRNAIPPQESNAGEGPRFISKNPRLAKILKNKEKKR